MRWYRSFSPGLGGARCKNTNRYNMAVRPKTFCLELLEERVLLSASAITSGQTVIGSLTPGQTNSYVFEAHAGDSVEITMGLADGSTSNAKSQIDLIAPDGTQAFSQYAGVGGGLNVSLDPLAHDGTYTIVASAAGNNDFLNYHLTMAKGPGIQMDPDGGIISSGQTVTGILNPGDADVYTFDARAGDSVEIVMGLADGSYYDAKSQIVLLAPDGTPLVHQAAGIGGGLGVAPDALPQDGTYVIVASAAGSSDLLNYHLTMAKAPATQTDPNGGVISSGQTVTGSLNPGDADVYTFEARAGDSVDIAMELADGSYYNAKSQIVFIAPDGTQLIKRYAGVGGYLDATLDALPQDGSYTIIASEAGSDDFLHYSLSLGGSIHAVDNITPHVLGVKFSGAGQDTTITIRGFGFGATPSDVPFTGDSNFLYLYDNGGGGSAKYFFAGGSYFGEYAAASVTLKYESWTNNEIVIGGFAGPYGANGEAVLPGDSITIHVWNSIASRWSDPSATWNGVIPTPVSVPPQPQMSFDLSIYPAQAQIWNRQQDFQDKLMHDPGLAQSMTSADSTIGQVALANAPVGGWKDTFERTSNNIKAIGSYLSLGGSLMTPNAYATLPLEASIFAMEQTHEFEDNIGANFVVGAGGLVTNVASLAENCGLATLSGGWDIPNDGGCVFSASGLVSTYILSPAFHYLANDPPDVNYNQVFVSSPVVSQPLKLPPTYSPNLASALSKMVSSLDQTIVDVNALEITANRYGSALEAGDSSSAAMQYAAFLQYMGAYNTHAESAARAMNECATLLRANGLGTQLPTADVWNQSVAALQTQGATMPGLLQYFETLGFSDDEIGTMIQQAVANLPPRPTIAICDALGQLSVQLKSVSVSDASIVVATGPGVSPMVRILESRSQQTVGTITPFDSSFRGGTTVASGDVNADGTPDIIVAAGVGGSTNIRVFDGNTDEPLSGPLGSFLAYPGVGGDPAVATSAFYKLAFQGQINVAAGDINGDGHDDIIVSIAADGPPHLKVFSGADGSELMSMLVYPGASDPADPAYFGNAFQGGVRVASGDVTGDGRDDIITGAGPGAGPHVKVFDGATQQAVESYFAYDPAYSGGVRVAAGDYNGDGRAEIITSAGVGAGPHVKAIDAASGNELASFYAYDPGFLSGIWIASADLDGDGKAEILAIPGAGGGPNVKVFQGGGGYSPNAISSFFAFDQDYVGGSRIAAPVG